MNFAFRIRFVLFLLCAAACEPLGSSSAVDASFGRTALVLAGTADQAQSWSVKLDIDGAPVGDYLLFAAFEAPTSRRQTTEQPSLRVTGTVSIAGSGGCGGDPSPPAIEIGSLDN